jgi:Leucine-rich repeat (LRR) protein
MLGHIHDSIKKQTNAIMNYSTWLKAIVAFLCLSTSLTAQVVNIPDPNFKSALVNNPQINTNGDGEIQTSEAQAFAGTINVPFRNIHDLTGVEAFTAVTRLNVNNNQLTSMNVSANTRLVGLRCNHNMLSSLDVHANTQLTDLQCYVNQIGSLDVSALPGLSILYAAQNQLTEIDLSHNPALTQLRIDFNLLVDLDLSTNSSLTYLDCKQNKLKTLNVRNGNNSDVTYFNAVRNVDLFCVEVDNPAYSEANWTQVEAGTQFSTDCGGASGEVVYIPDANFKAVLLANKSINVNSDNEIQVLEASGYQGTISAGQKGIADLTGLEAFSKLTQLYVPQNAIRSLDVTHNPELRVLRCNDNPLTSLNVSNNPHLISIETYKASLTSLDLHSNVNLEVLSCFYNQLASLDLSANTKLTAVFANRNKLTTLTLGSKPGLRTLVAFDNLLPGVDISGATALETLELQQNKLTSLDIANNSALSTLNVGNNMLTALNFSGKINLAVVSAFNNKLTQIDLSHNPRIISVIVYKNNLTSFNIKNGNNTRIFQFDATKNPGLTCIQVDDPAYSNARWSKDPQTQFSVDCGFPSEDVVFIPDPALRAKIFEHGVDTNNDSKIQYSEAEAFTGNLNLDGAGILDQTGIEAFINVPWMNWEHNDMTRLDLRQNTGLRSLDCGYMDLTELYVNPGLQRLFCYTNRLTSLASVKDLTGLVELDFSDNQIHTFNMSEYAFASVLEILGTGGNQINSMDLTAGTALKVVGIQGVNVPTIDLHNAHALTYISIFDNPGLRFINIKNGNNANVTHFTVQYNPLLTCVEVDDKEYAESHWTLQWGQPDAHFSEDCDGSEGIVSIPDANFKQAVVSNPQINTNGDNEIQVSEARNFDDFLNLFGKGISDLTGIEEFINITGLDVSENSLTELYLQHHDQLETLFCRNNSIAAFSIYECDGLMWVDCQGNQMGSIITPFNLEMLNASQNKISGVNLGMSPNLIDVNLANNQLTKIDVVDNPDLKVLHVENNMLTWLNLNIAHEGGLTELEAANNDLTCIQVDDPAYAEANWRDDVDAEARFNTHCEGDPNIVYIPDPKLKEILVGLVDGNNEEQIEDGEVQYDEAREYYGMLDISDAVSGGDIADVTGIGAFFNVEALDCSGNQITRIDQSPNVLSFYCNNNQITEITVDLSNVYDFFANNNQLTRLPKLHYVMRISVGNNKLTAIDNINTSNSLEYLNCTTNKITDFSFANFQALSELFIGGNLLTSLDISDHEYTMYKLDCSNNQLTSLNIKNGQNENISFFNAINNPDLTCVEVDDAAAAEARWRQYVDPQVSFSENCSAGAGFRIAVSPNPTMGRLTIEGSDMIDEVMIFDGMSGGLVSREKGNELDLSYLRNGLYFLKVRSGEKEVTTRIVKK